MGINRRVEAKAKRSFGVAKEYLCGEHEVVVEKGIDCH
jgi:hypothetical protein